MFNKVLAVVAAATGAAVIVGLIPEPEPAAAKAETGTLEKKATEQDNGISPAARDCEQGWPHYAQSCLSDRRQPSGKARVARRDKLRAHRAWLNSA